LRNFTKHSTKKVAKTLFYYVIALCFFPYLTIKISKPYEKSFSIFLPAAAAAAFSVAGFWAINFI
jgi:hypothetical protein